MNEEKNYYTRTSKYHYKNKIDYLSINFFLREHKKRILLIKENSTYNLLLDSNLITYSSKKNYDVKIIQCGSYYQVYKFLNKRITVDKDFERENKIKPIFQEFSEDNIEHEEFGYKEIEEKNVKRSKVSLERLVMTNEEKFKTFITLTFKDNMTDIKQANQLLSKFLNNMKNRHFKDLCYISVPEFQKRGAIHYHLVTNINYDNFNLLSNEEIKIWDKRKSKWQIFRTCLYWKVGFSSVIKLDSISVVGYLSKYMTKDIDNRLFGFRRFSYSQNLRKPSILNLDLSNIEDFKRLLKIYDTSEKKYSFKYLSKYTNDFKVDENGLAYNVEFIEFKLNA